MRGRNRVTPIAFALTGISVLVFWLVPGLRQSIESNWNWIAIIFVFIGTGQAVWYSTEDFKVTAAQLTAPWFLAGFERGGGGV